MFGMNVHYDRGVTKSRLFFEDREHSGKHISRSRANPNSVKYNGYHGSYWLSELTSRIFNHNEKMIDVQYRTQQSRQFNSWDIVTKPIKQSWVDKLLKWVS